MGSMRKYAGILVVILIGVPGYGLDLYVAVGGDDGNPGTEAKPVATLEKAQDLIRKAKGEQGFITEAVNVWLREGTYEIKRTFELDGRDAGIPGRPVCYRAYKNERVVLQGGKCITPAQLKHVTEEQILKRLLSEKAKKNVRVVDLTEMGIDDLGTVVQKRGARRELYFDKKYMTLARYPNTGYLEIADVPQTGEKLINEGRIGWEIEGVPRGRHYGRFTSPVDRPGKWSFKQDIYAHGYWVYDWRDEIIKLEKFDPNTNDIYPQPPYHHYGYQKGARFYFLNILEELDGPGEWYLDAKEEKLYFWPPGEVTETNLVVPMLSDYMVKITDTRFVRFENITFAGARAGAVMIKGGDHNLIAGCRFYNLGNDAVVIEGGVENGIQSCDIYEVSANGINLSGGERKTLTAANNFARNNHIHRWARVFLTYAPAIKIEGVGQVVSNNFMHNGPHSAVLIFGNNHTLEYNEIAEVVGESDDAGAIYLAADWSFAGNLLRYNYIHDVISDKGHVPVMAIYLDLPVGGMLVYGNIIEDVARGFFTNCGRGCLIKNNIFINCQSAIFFNAYRAPKQFQPGGPWRLVEKLEEVNYTQPPYSMNYPWLAKVLSEGDDPALPIDNAVIGNIIYKGRFLELGEVDYKMVKVENNLIAEATLCTQRKISKEKKISYKTFTGSDKEFVQMLEVDGNVITENDPVFIDSEKGNLRLKSDCWAFKLGFEQIPYDRIGLILDEFRREIPEGQNSWNR